MLAAQCGFSLHQELCTEKERRLLLSLLTNFHLHTTLGHLGHHGEVTTTTSSLGVLTTNLESPEVTETSVVAASLHALEIHTEGTVQVIGGKVNGLTILKILASVQEPGRDLELKRRGHDRDDLVHVIGGQLTSALVQVDIALLADQVCHAAADTLDGGQGVHDLLASIDVGIAHTQDVLEVLGRKLNSRHFVSLSTKK